MAFPNNDFVHAPSTIMKSMRDKSASVISLQETNCDFAHSRPTSAIFRQNSGNKKRGGGASHRGRRDKKY